jgi:hypothetical protein
MLIMDKITTPPPPPGKSLRKIPDKIENKKAKYVYGFIFSYTEAYGSKKIRI